MIYRNVVQFPIVCLTLALLCDIIYWRTSNLMWTEFSAWLLLVGITLGLVAALVRLGLLVTDGAARRNGDEWLQFAGLVVILVLAFFNNLIHARDGWTSVVPWGLTLSALTVISIALTGWLGAGRLKSSAAGVGRHA
jgi:uncharacterized membrane protein